MAEADDSARWADAALAAAVLATDPVGLGGAIVRAAHGPAREHWLAWLRALAPERTVRRVPSHIGPERLLGGLDLAATLAHGKPVAQPGLATDCDGGLLVLPMAERFPPVTIALLCALLDTGEAVVERQGIALRAPARVAVIALDEGIADEGVRPELVDRVAFHLELEGLRVPADATPSADVIAAIAAARARLPAVTCPDEVLRALCATALALGIDSLRPSLFALRVACVLAALDGREIVDDDDASTAARLVLAPRAVVLPAQPDEAEAAPPPPAEGDDADNETDPADADDSGDDENARGDPEAPLEDRVIAAAVAAIPRDLLERIAAGRARRMRGATDGRAGALRASLVRGRPTGARRGDPRAGVRLNLIDTLRAAAPWQPLRRRARAAEGRPSGRVDVRRDDFHVTRYQQRTPSTTIFVVDASGSAAMHRLGEAKGAVELLLADCYVRRDEVAVIAFRGARAELVLPPTRSLVRAKRALAGLPGGAGTPLATAIDAAMLLALQVRRGGHTPTVVFLTDAQANVARDGTGGRERAGADAAAAAGRLRSEALAAVFVDTSPRPSAPARKLADAMGARYVALPHADARRVSAVVRGARESA
jgi:magnesium chelatase subunit D